MSTKNYGDELELLDVKYIIDITEKGGFYVKNYIKPTAENRVFVNGKSHHPQTNCIWSVNKTKEIMQT